MRNRLLFVVLLASSILLPAAERKPRLAFVEKKSVFLADAKGNLLNRLDLPFFVDDFAVSPDGKRIVLVEADQGEHGGPLYLVDVVTNKLKKLTTVTNAVTPDADHETYSAPDFSPSGEEVVYAVHGERQSDAAGPVAIMNLTTESIRILAGTEQNTKYVDAVHWSPDGTRILVKFDRDTAVFSLAGHTGHDLETPQESAAVLGWLNESCLIYAASNAAGSDKDVNVFHLKSGKTEPAASALRVDSERLAGAEDVEVARELVLVRRANDAVLIDPQNEKPTTLRSADVHLIGAGKSSNPCE